MADIWVQGINAFNTYAGIFEADDDVGWFYLYKIFNPADVNEKLKVIDAVQVCRGTPDFSDKDCMVQWNDAGTHVSLFIKGSAYAYFDLVEGRGVPGRYPDRPLNRTVQ
jgi:hypothetical protein